MTDYAQARKNMVDCQIHTNGVIDPKVLHAFETLPRELYVDNQKQSVAYHDEDIKVGKGRYVLEPYVHARMVQELRPKPSDVVLDIGGGYGYSAAVLSGMVMTVIALESEQSYLEHASKAWNSQDICNVVSVQGDLQKGHAENAPYDLIFINGAVSEVPQNLKEQLTSDGRMVCVVKNAKEPLGEITVTEALGNNKFSSYILFKVATPYLEGFEPTAKFSF